MEMPGDGLSLAVAVSGQVQLVGVGEQALELAYLLALVAVDDVQRLEAVVHIDAETGPRLGLVGRGNLCGPAGQVSDVADGRLHHEAGAEVARDGLRLGGRLHDHQSIGHGLSERLRLRPGVTQSGRWKALPQGWNAGG